jgi:hypothetical protein
MKKIAIGIAALFSLFTATSFAVSTVTSKNDVSIPCYNSGFSFGLAGYFSTPIPSSDLTSPSSEHNGCAEVTNSENIQPDYK